MSRMLASPESASASNAGTSGVRGTLRYMSRESLQATDEASAYSTASDVWAFGMTVYVRILLLCDYVRLLYIVGHIDEASTLLWYFH